MSVDYKNYQNELQSLSLTIDRDFYIAYVFIVLVDCK